VSAEAHLSFGCFGGTAAIHVRAAGPAGGREIANRARATLLDAHRQLSRFIPESELSRLNGDPRWRVPATPLLLDLAGAVASAGSRSGGLVDATLLGALERAGYRESLDERRVVALSDALSSRAGRAPAEPNPAGSWRLIHVDEATGSIVRPPGVRIDSGGIAKGLLADRLAATLREQRTYAVDCCGDVRIGGSAGQERRILVDDPFGGDPVHELALREGAVATSGIGRRCWIGPGWRAAHHILDPCSGEPAFTGLVQATALAPTALLAEVLAKCALLSGPEGAAEWLPHGGVLVHDGGEVDVLAPGRGLPRTAVAS
jgi:thiamine biosynthesis lipoprotein